MWGSGTTPWKKKFPLTTSGFVSFPSGPMVPRRTLTIEKRKGSFPGMQQERTFQVVLVSKDKPVGFSFTPKADKSTRYDGTAVDVRL